MRDDGHRAASVVVPLLLLLATLLAAAAPAAAQLPELPTGGGPQSTYKDIALSLNRTYVMVPYLGRGEIEITLEDLSRDSLQQPGGPPASGGAQIDQILVDLTFVGGAKTGWAAGTTLSSVGLYGGQLQRGTIFISTSGAVRDPIVRLNVTATLTLSDGTVITDDEQITAQVAPFYQGQITVVEFPDGYIDLFQEIKVPVEIENTGLYLDAFQINVTAPPGWMASVSPNVYVPPGEKVRTNVTIWTPSQLFDLGSSSTIQVFMRSVGELTGGLYSFQPGNSTGATLYTTVIGVQTRGVHAPQEAIPGTLLGLLCLGLLVRHERDGARLRALEKGRARPVRLTPRQRALLMEMKRRDPDAYRARKAELAAVHKARRDEYRSHRREEVRREREERKAARRELAEERKRRAAEKRVAAQAEKERRKVEAAARKERKRRMAKLGAEKARLEKLRAKAAKKQAKIDAKLAKKQAKIDAKNAKVARAQAAKDAKAAAKAAKAAAKAANKGKNG